MESTPKKRKLENDLNLNTPSPKRSRRELSLKEKYDLIQASERIPKPTQKDIHPQDVNNLVWIVYRSIKKHT
jgi:hypothetical protein